MTCEKQKEAEDGWKVSFAMDVQTWMPVGSLKEASSLTVAFDGVREVEDVSSAGQWPGVPVCREALKMIQNAWNDGAPMSPHPQTRREGRWAMECLGKGLGVSIETAELMVIEWQRTGVLRFETFSSKSKMKGLKVAQWPEWAGGTRAEVGAEVAEVDG